MVQRLKWRQRCRQLRCQARRRAAALLLLAHLAACFCGQVECFKPLMHQLNPAQTAAFMATEVRCLPGRLARRLPEPLAFTLLRTAGLSSSYV